MTRTSETKIDFNLIEDFNSNQINQNSQISKRSSLDFDENNKSKQTLFQLHKVAVVFRRPKKIECNDDESMEIEIKMDHHHEISHYFREQRNAIIRILDTEE